MRLHAKLNYSRADQIAHRISPELTVLDTKSPLIT